MKFQLTITADSKEELLELLAGPAIVTIKAEDDLPGFVEYGTRAELPAKEGIENALEDAGKAVRGFNEATKEALNDLSEKAHKVEPPKVVKEAAQKEQEAAQEITLADVQRAFKDKATRQNRAHLQEILKAYGAAKVSQLKPEDYADVLQGLELVEV